MTSTATDRRSMHQRRHAAAEEAHELLRGTSLSRDERCWAVWALIGDVAPEVQLDELRDALTGRLGPASSLRTRSRNLRLEADAVDALADDIEANSPLARRRRQRVSQPPA